MLASVTTVLLAAILMAAHPTRPKTMAARRAQTAINGFRPSVRWHPVLRADINCDGSFDNIFTGRDDDHFYVAAVLGGQASHPRSASPLFNFVAEPKIRFAVNRLFSKKSR
jgi:hypothetical protein